MRKEKAMLSVALAAAMTLGSAVPTGRRRQDQGCIYKRDSGDTPISKGI